MSGVWGGMGALVMLYLASGWAGQSGYRGIYGTGVPVLDALHGILIAFAFLGVPVFIIGWLAGSVVLRPFSRWLSRAGLWAGPALAFCLPLPFFPPSAWGAAVLTGGVCAWLAREWTVRRTWENRTLINKERSGVW